MARFSSLGSKHMHNVSLAFHEYVSYDTQSVGSVTGLINSPSLSHTRGCMAIGHILGVWMTDLASSLKLIW